MGATLRALPRNARFRATSEESDMSIKPEHNDVSPYILTQDAKALTKFLAAVFGATEAVAR